jgi:hypothetical protein
MQGISNPKTLVWKDEKSGRIFYVEKIAGTRARLYYMGELKTGEKPALLSEFTGTILLWKNLKPALAKSMAAAFKRDWNTNIDPDNTYIIKGNQKPEGCK